MIVRVYFREASQELLPTCPLFIIGWNRNSQYPGQFPPGQPGGPQWGGGREPTPAWGAQRFPGPPQGPGGYPQSPSVTPVSTQGRGWSGGSYTQTMGGPRPPAHPKGSYLVPPAAFKVSGSE